jgi:hypothetical protein
MSLERLHTDKQQDDIYLDSSDFINEKSGKIVAQLLAFFIRPNKPYGAHHKSLVTRT